MTMYDKMPVFWFFNVFLLATAFIPGIMTSSKVTVGAETNSTGENYNLTFSTCWTNGSGTYDTVQIILTGERSLNITLTISSKKQDDKGQVFARGKEYNFSPNTTDIGSVCQIHVRRMNKEKDSLRLEKVVVIYKNDVAEFTVNKCHSEDEFVQKTNFLPYNRSDSKFITDPCLCPSFKNIAHPCREDTKKPPEVSEYVMELTIGLLGLVLVIISTVLIRSFLPRKKQIANVSERGVTTEENVPDQTASRDHSLLNVYTNSSTTSVECLSPNASQQNDQTWKRQHPNRGNVPKIVSWTNNSLYATTYDQLF